LCPKKAVLSGWKEGRFLKEAFLQRKKGSSWICYARAEGGILGVGLGRKKVRVTLPLELRPILEGIILPPV